MKNNILLIESDDTYRNVLETMLAEEFNVTAVTSAEDGFNELTKHENYLVVILDLELPERDGLELLEKFNESHPINDITVIFLSNDDNDDTIVECFLAGGEHFISKKYSLDVINQKIQSLVHYKKAIKKLSTEEDKLNDLVTTTMLQSSFYGACLDLVSDLQFAENEEKMAQYIFDFMKRYGIDTAISFDAPNIHFDFDQVTFYCSPLEKKVFDVLKDKGRIYEFGNRAMFNSPCFSLLIKNMPEKDSVNYGLFIDIFAKLVPSVEMSFKNLLNKQKLKITQGKLQSTIETIQDATIRLQRSRQELIDDVVMQIGLSFHEYEFTDNQEEFLTKMLEDNIVKQSEHSEIFLEINQELADVLTSLEKSQEGEELGYIDTAPIVDIELF